MIEQGVYYANSIVKNEWYPSNNPRKSGNQWGHVKSLCFFYEKNQKRQTRRGNWDDCDSSVMVSSEESSIDYKLVAKNNCVLHEKCSHTTDNCKDLGSMNNKHKKKRKTSKCIHRARMS